MLAVISNSKRFPVLMVLLAVAMILTGCRTTEPLPGSVSQQTFSVYTGLQLGNINKSNRAQDDLYGHANGLWLNSFVLPEDRSSFGVFNYLVDEVSLFLLAAMEDVLATPARELRTEERKLKDFYASYFNMAAINARGLSPLDGFMADIESVGSNDSLAAVFGRFSANQVSLPFRLFVEEDPQDASNFIFHLEQGGLGMPGRDFYLEQGEEVKAIRDGYIRYIETLFTLAGDTDPAGNAVGVFALETRLAQAQWPLAETRDRDRILNITPHDQLMALTPAFDWGEYFGALGHIPAGKVVVRQPSYFRSFNAIIEETPPGVWRNYLRFHLLNTFARFLPEGFTKARFDFYFRTLANVNATTPRERDVLNIVNTVFRDVFAKAYMRDHYDPGVVQMVEAMAVNIKDAFRLKLQTNAWMSDATRVNALEKLETLKFRIGGPQSWIDYSSLRIKDDELLRNVLNFYAFDFRLEAQKTIAGAPAGAWLAPPQTVNAFYNPAQNEVVVPLAMLQPPMFDPEVDMAANYGALGAIIAHEIVHGFDDQGRKMNQLGRHHNWWAEADAAYFNQTADRLAERYSGFSPLPGFFINGRQTLGENIGDIEGLALAFEAYRLTNIGGGGRQMAGYSGEQRFFLGWAQLWARVYQEAELRRLLLTGVHSPGEYRVNGVVQNIDGFYDAFGVVPGDALYLAPQDRIRIW